MTAWEEQVRIRMAYGRQGVSITVPDDARVIAPRAAQPLSDPRAAFHAALEEPIRTPPLREIMRSDHRVCIVIPDGTRACPSHLLIPWLLEALHHVPDEHITILNGTGTHRPNTPQELEAMLGREVPERVQVVNHSATDRAALKRVGRLRSGVDVWLNRRWVEADRRIVIGFIEPHFFAGFSGGAKGICPGVAGLETILHLHGAPLIAHPAATWAEMDRNPIQQGIQEAVAMAPPHFMINVTLTPEQEITGIYAGHYIHAHREGCREVANTATQPVPHPFDIVITSNSGYPLDQNLYQTVKGMSAAARIVRQGGAILITSECSDGIPEHGPYARLLRMRETPAELLEMIMSPGFQMQDQWQVQIQAQIQRKADVYLYSSLPDAQVRSLGLTPVADPSAALSDLISRYGGRVAVLPEGPLTIPYLHPNGEDEK